MPLTKNILVLIFGIILNACADQSEIIALQRQINSIETDMYTVSSLAAVSKEDAIAEKASVEQTEQKLLKRKASKHAKKVKKK